MQLEVVKIFPKNSFFGKNLLYLLLKHGSNQRELADKLEMAPSAVSKWSRGDGFPEVSILAALSVYFRVDLHSLFFSDLSADDPNISVQSKYAVEPIIHLPVERVPTVEEPSESYKVTPTKGSYSSADLMLLIAKLQIEVEQLKARVKQVEEDL